MTERRQRRIILIGDCAVGKTALMNKYCGIGNDTVTLGVSHVLKDIDIGEGRTVDARIWDTCGQEKFNSMVWTYAKKAACAIVVFSFDDRESFEHVPKWINDLRDHIQENHNIPIIIVGTKTDLERVVTFEQLRIRAKELELPYYHCSVKTNENVSQVFEAAARLAYDCIVPEEPGTVVINPDPKPPKRCC